MRNRSRRLAVALASTLVGGLLTGPGLLASPAQAAPAPNGYATSAGDWLSGQLTDGVVHNEQYDYDDYGLALDVFFALHRLGVQQSSQTAIIDRLKADPTLYTEYQGNAFAGSLGKLSSAVQEYGLLAKSFGGHNLISELADRVHTASDGQQGRATDEGTPDYSNTIGQTWVVRALTHANSTLADEATAFLLQQQCVAGYFRVTLEPTTGSSAFTCDGAASADKTPSVDATALAIDTLVQLRDDENISGLDEEIDAAGNWLASVQASDGSFSDDGNANSNSTGLAAAALGETGHTVAAGNAAGWLLSHQATAYVAKGTKLANQVGAIAFDTAAFDAGKKSGIGVEEQDQWRRATAQAATGLARLLPRTTPVVGTPASYQRAGSELAIKTTGLLSGERFVTSIGSVSKSGKVGSDGSTTSTFRLGPKSRTATYTVLTDGSWAGRRGTGTVKALGGKRLGMNVRDRSIGKGHTEKVRITGLAPSERTRLYYKHALIWDGTADKHGEAVHYFNVGRSAGRQSVVGKGAFSNRLVATSITVS